MAKKKTARKKQPAAKPDVEVREAEEKVDLAREALRQAEEYCQQIRQQAAEQVDRLRQTSLGDALEGSLELVRKHPGAGVSVALAVGIILGRMFRR